MTRSDRVIGPLCFLFGCLVVLESSKLEFASSYGAGSGFFPYWLGITIVILGAVITLNAWRSAAGADSPTGHTWPAKRLLAVVLLVSFVLVFERIGFVTAFALIVAFLLRLEGEQWPKAVSVALAAGSGFYVFFIRSLNVDLPAGPLGF